MSTPDIKQRQLLRTLLVELEVQLRLVECWQSTRPSEHLLLSQEPFAIDTLSFPQWLQFIFIEKMTRLLQFNLSLPLKMDITPMASEYFKIKNANYDGIIALIKRIDLVINEKNRC